jgi:hypothetical protein
MVSYRKVPCDRLVVNEISYPEMPASDFLLFYLYQRWIEGEENPVRSEVPNLTRVKSVNLCLTSGSEEMKGCS